MGKATGFAERVLRRTVVTTYRHWRFIVPLVAIDALPRIMLEFTADDVRRFSSFVGLLTLYLQLPATFRALDRAGLLPLDRDRRRPTEGRYPSAFLLGLLTTLAVLLGLLVLIVPGLLLAGSWGMALPALAAERRRPVDAMRRSWRLARLRLVSMTLLATMWLGAAVLTLATATALLLWSDVPPALVAAVADLCISSLLILAPVMWATAYAERVAEIGSPDEGAT